MSGIFDDEEGQRPTASRRAPSARPRALLPTLAIVVVLVVLFSFFVELWTSKMWYHSISGGQFDAVFTTLVWTRVALFVVGGLVLSGVVVGNILIAFRTRPILIGDGYRNPTVERYQDTLDPVRHWAVIAIGVLMFIFGGSSAAGHWKTYLMWRHGVHWGQNDVFFHRDIGFFVFGYPWYRFLLSFGFTTLVVGILAATATSLPVRRDQAAGPARPGDRRCADPAVCAARPVHAVEGGGVLARQVRARDHQRTPADRDHLHRPARDAPGQADPGRHRADLCAVVLRQRDPARPGCSRCSGWDCSCCRRSCIGGIWPAIVQRFQVKPSEPDKEAPYIAMNIAATRDAYNLNNVQVQQYPGITSDTPKQLQTKADQPSRRPVDRPSAGRPGLRAAAAGARLLQDARRAGRRPLHPARAEGAAGRGDRRS